MAEVRISERLSQEIAGLSPESLDMLEPYLALTVTLVHGDSVMPDLVPDADIVLARVDGEFGYTVYGLPGPEKRALDIVVTVGVMGS